MISRETQRDSTAPRESGVARTYGVELFGDEARPVLNKQELLEAIRNRLPSVQPADGMAGSGPPVFELADASQDGKGITARWALFAADRPPEMDRLKPSCEQSWQWPDASETVRECRGSVLLTDLLAAGLRYDRRLELFQEVLLGVLEVIPARAIHWMPAQQFLRPDDLIGSLLGTSEAMPLHGAVNVRLYQLGADEPGGKGDLVMDTMGLAALGLFDLQCQFRGLDPPAVARVLYNTAFYEFEHGPVIETGNTVQGLRPQDKWTCRLTRSVLDPVREVIDLDPGSPYGSGPGRDHSPRKAK